jgi:hypothetical protein
MNFQNQQQRKEGNMSEEKKEETEIQDLDAEREVKGGGGTKPQSGGTGGVTTQPVPKATQ